MKTILLLIMWILLVSSLQSKAQTNSSKEMGSILLGPVAGFGNSWVSYIPGAATFKPSGYVGIGMVNYKTTHWGWGGLAIISSEGYQINYFNNMETVTPVYLRVPLRAYYFFEGRNSMLRPVLYLGPSFAMKLSEHSTTTNNYRDIYMVGNSDNFRMFDAGIDAGAGINIKLAKNTWLNMDLGFYEGITDAVRDLPNTYDPNRDMDLNIGLLFGIR